MNGFKLVTNFNVPNYKKLHVRVTKNNLVIQKVYLKTPK